MLNGSTIVVGRESPEFHDCSSLAFYFLMKLGKNNENIISVNTWNKVADACAEHLTAGSIVKATGILGRVEETSKLFIEASSVEFVKHEGGF